MLVGIALLSYYLKMVIKLLQLVTQDQGYMIQMALILTHWLNIKKNYGVLDIKHSGNQGVKVIDNSGLLELGVDVLVPAALENQITGSNVKKLKQKLLLSLQMVLQLRMQQKYFMIMEL